MIRAAALILAMLMGTTAAAQTTVCEESLPGSPQFGVTCKTSPPPGSIDPRNVAPRPCSIVDRYVFDAPSAVCEARAVAAQHKAVGDLIAAGNCDAAVKAALATGDLAYARQVRDYCAPAPKP